MNNATKQTTDAPAPRPLTIDDIVLVLPKSRKERFQRIDGKNDKAHFIARARREFGGAK